MGAPEKQTELKEWWEGRAEGDADERKRPSGALSYNRGLALGSARRKGEPAARPDHAGSAKVN